MITSRLRTSMLVVIFFLCSFIGHSDGFAESEARLTTWLLDHSTSNYPCYAMALQPEDGTSDEGVMFCKIEGRPTSFTRSEWEALLPDLRIVAHFQVYGWNTIEHVISSATYEAFDFMPSIVEEEIDDTEEHAFFQGKENYRDNPRLRAQLSTGKRLYNWLLKGSKGRAADKAARNISDRLLRTPMGTPDEIWNDVATPIEKLFRDMKFVTRSTGASGTEFAAFVIKYQDQYFHIIRQVFADGTYSRVFDILKISEPHFQVLWKRAMDLLKQSKQLTP